MAPGALCGAGGRLPCGPAKGLQAPQHPRRGGSRPPPQQTQPATDATPWRATAAGGVPPGCRLAPGGRWNGQGDSTWAAGDSTGPAGRYAVVEGYLWMDMEPHRCGWRLGKRGMEVGPGADGGWRMEAVQSVEVFCGQDFWPGFLAVEILTIPTVTSNEWLRVVPAEVVLLVTTEKSSPYRDLDGFGPLGVSARWGYTYPPLKGGMCNHRGHFTESDFVSSYDTTRNNRKILAKS